MQEDKGADEHPERQTFAMARQLAIVDIDEIGKPGDGRPRFFRIPRPVVPPCLLGPESTEEHANGEEGEAYIDEVVRDVTLDFVALLCKELLVSDVTLFDKEQIDMIKSR